MIVVDASVVVQVLIADEAGIALARRLAAEDGQIAAPHLLDIEVASALRRLDRSKPVRAATASDAMTDFRSLRIERHSHEDLFPRIWSLRNELSAYDAAYVALAESLDAQLWTRDARLAKARGPRCQIVLL